MIRTPWRTPRLRTAGAVLLAGALAIPATVGMTAPAQAASGDDTTHVVISEAYLVGGSANQPYTNKFVELYNPTDAPVDLSGWSIQYRSASGPRFPAKTELSGTIAAGGHYLVSGSSNGATGEALPAPDASGALAPSGTDGVIALASTTQSLPDLPAGSAIGVSDIVDLLGYGTANAYEVAAAPAGQGTKVAGSLQRTGYADDNSQDFAFGTEVTPQNTAGETDGDDTAQSGDTGSGDGGDGTAEPPADSPDDVTPIAGIQGTGAASPLTGQTVTTQGVVTAAYPQGAGSFTGYVIQTPGEDTTPGASDALFVYSQATADQVEVGDSVRVTGEVSEYKDLTELSVAASGLTILPESLGTVAPLETGWPATDAEREALESMLIQPTGDFTVSNTYSTNQYGEVGLASGGTPLIQPTDAAPAGSEKAAEVEADNAARAVTLDDATTINYLSTANSSLTPPYISTENPVRVGAAVTFDAPVIVDYRNDAWKLNPTEAIRDGGQGPVAFENTRTKAPEPVGGDIRIATFNVLNYFTTLGADTAGCEPDTDRAGDGVTVKSGCDPRGAWDAEDLARQQDKIVSAINAVDADVIGLLEIENSAALGENPDEALATLVGALNTAAGSTKWAYVPSSADLPDVAAQDVITNALIYQPASVQRVGDARALGTESSTDGAFANAREPIGQKFAPVGGGEPVFVAVNHLKSKGSAGPLPGDEDQHDGQGASNASRVAQATALRDWIATVTDEGDAVALVGDFNSYTQEDPLQVLYQAGYTDAASELSNDQWSYSYSGLSGSLDHVLLNQAALKRATGEDTWEINAEESIALEYSRYNYHGTLYDASGPYRSSDHDPVVVGLAAGQSAPVDLDIVDINDFHGRIDANTTAFAKTVEDLKAQNPDGTLFVSAGDNIGASLFASSSQQDQPTIDVLNALGLQVSAVGNHEFDQGYDDLKGRVHDAADFPYLGANVYEKGTTTPALPEYEVINARGIRVGFIGVITQETPTLVSPGGVSTLDFGDPVDALNRVTGQLSDGNDANGEADVLVALVHEGAGAGTPDGATLDEEVAAGGAFAKIVTGTDARVDAILTGHTHKEYAWEAPVPGEDGATRPVIQTGSYGENLGHTSLSIDPDTFEVVAHEAENVKRGAAPTEQEIAASPALTRVDDIVTQALAHADEIGSQPVGSVTADITTAFGGGSFVDGTWTGGTRDDRASESALGNLVADALRDSDKLAELGGADIGIVNPGGLRNELYYAKSGDEGEDGVVTFAEANAVLPFVNNVWTVELTGAQLKEVLEEQWQTDADGNRPSRPYLALGLSDNVTWVAKTADPNATPGGNVLAVYVDGTLVRDDDTFTVSTFSFLAQGGDNFRTLAQGTSRDTGLIDRDVWMDYLGANSPVAPSFARSRVVAGALPNAVDAGKQASVTLSGLDLTSLGSPLNTTVSARLVPAGASSAGVPLGDFAIDEGAAAIAATIPAGTAAGEYTIVATAQPSGTAVRLPITVKAGSDQPGPDDPGTPGEDPVAPSAGDLTDGARGGITTDIAKVEQGGTVRVSVGVGHAGEKVNVWLHSDPVLLARSVVVPESGILTVTIPADTPVGAHKISVTAEDGTLLGWAPIEVLAADTPGTTPAGSDGASPKAAAKSGTGLSDTGAEISWPLGLALLLTAVGGALVTTRRRSGSQER